MFGTSSGAEQTENASSASDIEHDLILEQMFIPHDGVHVAGGPVLVFQHFLMNA